MDTKHIILVVEDERPLLAAIETKLTSSNFDVVTARNVEGALNHLKDIERIEVIWLDHYLLGKKSGLDFVAAVKDDETYKHIPIFVVSNTATPDKVQSYLRLGVHKYYTKSDHRLEGIIDDIKNYLEHNKED